MPSPDLPRGRILCFGELMLRLGPPQGELLLQSPQLTVRIGGAEANVAVSLARLGAPCAFATVLPDNPLGLAARDEVRRHGVDTAPVQFRQGRMGLYFVTPGAVRRPSEVLYDRSDSAFVRHAADAFDWPKLLEGVEWLHVSGVTPAVGPGGTSAAAAAVRAAVDAGVRVSYDGNFRSKLWAGWESDPAAILGGIFETAELAFADDRDIALVLGRAFEFSDPHERCRQAARAAFAAFPRLQRIASTLRSQTSVTDHSLSAVMLIRDGRDVREVRAPEAEMSGVVDRIGGGDAFTAGVLYGLWSGWPDERALGFGLSSAVLKHSIHGDFNLFSADEVEAAVRGDGLDIRR
jgi:2-dehydro-3-deoxygluconokinase